MKTRLPKLLRAVLIAALFASAASVCASDTTTTQENSSTDSGEVGDSSSNEGIVIISDENGTRTETNYGNELDTFCLIVGEYGYGSVTVGANSTISQSLWGGIAITADNYSNSIKTGMIIGRYNGSEGVVEFNGENATMATCAAGAVVGESGTGSLYIRSGAYVQVWGYVFVGLNSGAQGKVEVSDEGSKLNIVGDRDLFVGYVGNGDVSIKNGATISVSGLVCMGFHVNSKGTIDVIGRGSTLLADNLHVGHCGSGWLTIRDGGVVNAASKVSIGGTTEGGDSRPYVDNYNPLDGKVEVSGLDSILIANDSLEIGNNDGNGSLLISDGGAVNITGTLGTYNATLTMDSASYLTADQTYVATTGNSKLTLGGTNNLGSVSVASNNGASNLELTLLASGASVTQGAIVLCNQFSLVGDDSVTLQGSDSILSWADVDVVIDLSNGVEGVAGNRIYLLKEDENFVNFGDGLVIEGTQQNVDEDNYITVTKVVDGNTYTLDYVYDGISLKFANKATITSDIIPEDDDPSQDTYDVSSKIITRDIVGTVSTNGAQTTYTPNSDVVVDATQYVVAEGVNGDESNFEISTTSYLKETTTVRKNAEGQVMETDIQIDDLGINDLTLYVNDSEATISGGVVGLDNEGDGIDVGVRSKIDKVLVKEYGTLTLTDGATVNADRTITTEEGFITLDNATLNVGGGDLDKFRNNEEIKNSEMEWNSLASSTINNSTIDLSNGSAMNFAEVEDDQIATTVTVSNSTINLSDTSSVNAVSGVNMSVTNSTISGTGTLSGFTSSNNTYIAGKNNVGVLELKNIASSNDTMGVYIVGPKAISGILNTDTTNVISQWKLTGTTTVTNGTFQLNVIDDSSLLTEGTSFQIIALDSPLENGFTSFTETGTALMDGYVWDYSLLNSDGIVTVIFSELGDGTRIANTMFSSAKAVAYAGKVATDHLVNTYTGKYNFTDRGNNFWVSALGTYDSVGTSGTRAGYTFKNTGYAVGYDRAFSKRVIEGIAVGQTWGEQTPKTLAGSRYTAGKIDQDAQLVTLYGMANLLRTPDQKDELNLLHAISCGKVSNKSTKTALFNNKTASAKWDDDVWSVGLRGVWNHQLTNGWTISPFVGVDYEHVSQGSFTERLGNNTAHYSGGNYQNLDVSVGTSASCNFKFDNNMELTPMASIAYVGSVARNVPTVNVSTGNTKATREKAVNPGRNGITANVGVDWKINDALHVTAAYNLYAAQGATSQNANVTVNYAF